VAIGAEVLAIVGLILAGRYLIRPLFRLIGNLGEREMFIVAALFTVMASAAVMEALGLSTALGAFIAGVMLADRPIGMNWRPMSSRSARSCWGCSSWRSA
jgi:Kef-type K+ transport system membrane component KefB